MIAMDCDGGIGVLARRITQSITVLSACLLVLSFSVGPLQAHSQNDSPSQVVLLLSSDSEPYQEVVAGIKTVFEQTDLSHKLSILTLDNIVKGSLLKLGDNDFVVAIGTQATEYALRQNFTAPVFATFVTRSSLLSAYSPPGEADNWFPEQLQRALVLDQPAARLIALARILVPQGRHLGTVVNGSKSNRLEEFTAVIDDTPLDIQVASLLDESNPIKDLKQVFSGSDVFVVIPDTSEFNSKIAKWVLFLSYKHRIPVIGYSQKYSDAGALISLYATPSQIGRDTGEQLLELLLADESERAPAIIQYPRYFSLAVNLKVADSLDIQIENEAELLHKLISLENHKDVADKRL